MIQKVLEIIKGRSQTSCSFFDLWMRFMKANRKVFKSTVKEYNFIEQRLFPEWLIIFDYSFGQHRNRMHIFRVRFKICCHDVLNFKIASVSLFCVYRIDWNTPSCYNWICNINLGLNEKGQYMISWPMIFDKFFRITVIHIPVVSVVLVSKILPNLLGHFC